MSGVTLAILGAVLVTLAGLFSKPKQKNTTSNQPMKREPTLLSKRITFVGYTVMFASMLLFIVAGFVSDLRP